MTILQRFKAALEVGAVVDVTNHYVTRPDHPCYGTRRRQVTKVTGSSVTFDVGGALKWPKADQLEELADGWTVRGVPGEPRHPVGGRPFLTIRPVMP